MRQLDAAHLGIVGRVAGFQVVDVGVGDDAVGGGDNLGDFGVRGGEFRRVEHLFHHQPAGLAISFDVLLGDHPLPPGAAMLGTCCRIYVRPPPRSSGCPRGVNTSTATDLTSASTRLPGARRQAGHRVGRHPRQQRLGAASRSPPGGMARREFGDRAHTALDDVMDADRLRGLGAPGSPRAPARARASRSRSGACSSGTQSAMPPASSRVSCRAWSCACDAGGQHAPASSRAASGRSARAAISPTGRRQPPAGLDQHQRVGQPGDLVQRVGDIEDRQARAAVCSRQR